MKKKEIIITSLALISAVLITLGVTLAFFDYAKEGSTENTVTTGTITFLYTEVSGVGKGISLTDAFPISDEVGKSQVGEGNIFDFKITSTTTNKTSIPYEVTARKKSDSTLDDSVVKLYLTKVTGDSEEELLLDNYNNLTQTNKVLSSKYTEKTIYEGIVPEKSTNYEQSFRLRMWIDENTNFSPNEDGTYPYNGKTFTVTVNVYANAKIVTEEATATNYYAFGKPTTSSTTDYTTLGKNVFIKLAGEQFSVCIIKNGVLECFENNNLIAEQEHIQEVFGADNCDMSSGNAICISEDFQCEISAYDDINCVNYLETYPSCYIYSEGNIYCDTH